MYLQTASLQGKPGQCTIQCPDGVVDVMRCHDQGGAQLDDVSPDALAARKHALISQKVDQPGRFARRRCLCPTVRNQFYPHGEARSPDTSDDLVSLLQGQKRPFEPAAQLCRALCQLQPFDHVQHGKTGGGRALLPPNVEK